MRSRLGGFPGLPHPPCGLSAWVYMLYTTAESERDGSTGESQYEEHISFPGATASQKIRTF